MNLKIGTVVTITNPEDEHNGFTNEIIKMTNNLITIMVSGTPNYKKTFAVKGDICIDNNGMIWNIKINTEMDEFTVGTVVKFKEFAKHYISELKHNPDLEATIVAQPFIGVARVASDEIADSDIAMSLLIKK